MSSRRSNPSTTKTAPSTTMKGAVADSDQILDIPEFANLGVTGEETEEILPVPKRYQFVMDNKEKILGIHSSNERTPIFAMQCSYCQLWFKHCMFSNSNRKQKGTEPMCHWCQVEGDCILPNQFQVHKHIWCNKPGQKRCGENTTLEPSKEATIEDVPAPEVYTIVKKMTQKDRKAAARAMAQQAGL